MLPSRSKLRDHKEVHMDVSKACRCEECNKVFSSSENLKKHLIIHSSEWPFKCDEPECGKQFTQLSNLEWHKKTHLGDDGRDYECSKCFKRFSAKANLTQHMEIHTDWKGKEIVCNLEGCKKKFLYFSSLKTHIKSKHAIDYQRIYGSQNQEVDSIMNQVMTQDQVND